MTTRDEFREQVRERTDLLSIIEQTVEIKNWGKRVIKAKCPFHDDGTASLAIYADQGRWRCYGACNEGGDAFAWIMKRDHVDFPGAVELLAHEAGLQMPTFKQEDEGQRAARMGVREMLRLAADYYHQQLLHQPAAQPHRDYLIGRGFDQDVWERWYAGAAGSKNGLLAYFKQMGVDLQVALKVGLLGQSDNGFMYDRFNNRIVVPFLEGDQVVFMTGRTLDTDKAKAKWVHLNSTEHTHRVPYNWRSSSQDVVVVEGVFDVWAADMLGNPDEKPRIDAVGLNGLGFSDPLLEKTLRRRAKVWIALDNDGTVETKTIEGVALAAGPDRAKVVKWPSKDPADWLLDGATPEHFQQLLNDAPLWTQTLVQQIEHADESEVPALVNHAVGIAAQLDPAHADAMLGSIKRAQRVVKATTIAQLEREARKHRIGGNGNGQKSSAGKDDAPEGGSDYYYVRDGELWRGQGDNARCIMSGGTGEYITMVTVDDGEIEDSELELLIRLKAGREKIVRVPAKDSNEPGKVAAAMKAVTGPWITIQAKQGPYLIPAIEAVTMARGDMDERTEIVRTGWFEHDDELLFVAPGGIVGTLPNGYSVVAPHSFPAMKQFRVADDGEEAFTKGLKGIIHGLLNAFEPNVIYPGLAFAMLAPMAKFLPQHKFAMHFSGETGSLKTETAKVLSAFFGDFVNKPPLMNWRSTINSVEAQGFWMPDVVALLDDYKPRDVKPWDIVGLIQRYAEESGRGRLKRDGTFQRRQAMRCWLLSTGEDLPGGESSVLARMVSIRYPRRPQGTAYNDALREAQLAAPHFPTITAWWIKWLMANSKKENFEEDMVKYHKLIADKIQHEASETPNVNRISHNIAMLWVAWKYWWHFIAERFDSKEAKKQCWERVNEFHDVAMHLALSVAGQVIAEKPTAIFLSALQDALDQGTFALALKSELARPAGIVGWYDAEGIYILPEAYNMVSERLRKAGAQLGFTRNELYRLLNEEGLLVRTGKDTVTVPIQVGPRGNIQSKRVLHLKPKTLDTPTQPAKLNIPTDGE